VELQSEKTDLLETAFIRAQSEFPTIGRDSASRFKYASAGAIIRSILPILNKHMLNIKQKGMFQDHVEFPMIIVTQLAHESGQYSQSFWPVPYPHSEELKGVNLIQAFMSNKTYVERHALKSLLCLAIDDEDTDGEYVQHKDTISDKQIAFLHSKLKDNPKAIDWLKQKYKIDRIDDLLKKDFNDILNAMNKN
jgi:hypothetical protein